MLETQRIHPAIYTTAILGGVLGLIVVSRQYQPASVVRRAVPALHSGPAARSGRVANEPRPLEIPPGRFPLAPPVPRDEVPASFPAESQESKAATADEIGPVPEAKQPIDAPARTEGIQRLPSI